MKEKKIIIFIINIFAFVLSIIWIINSHGLESIITALILFTSLVSQVCIKKKGTLLKKTPDTLSPLAKNDNSDFQENHSVITESSTSFFHGKFCDAFPGLREDTAFFTSKKHIIKRLAVLFSSPIYFDDTLGYQIASDPIWWFRDGQSLYIKEFEPLKNGKVLIDIEELKIKKIVACRGSSYYRDFVYVECGADKPTNLYKYEKNQIQSMYKEYGYYREEYALFKNNKITRQEYDDGSAVIKGKLQQVNGAKLRVRYLTKYNFIIAAKFSPYNCTRFDMESKIYFDGLLSENISFNEFLTWINTFQKHRLDN